MTTESDKGQPTAPVSLLGFFGSRVFKLRAERGWSQAELATKAHTTGAMISYVENAKRVPTDDLALDLDAAFGTDFFAEFFPLVVAYAYPSWFLPYVELERGAKTIRSFQSQIIPGLLQTEDYARAMLAPVRQDNLDDLIAARLTRQALFERDNPPHTWFIMDEQALRRRIGGPGVMRAQLERLLSAGQHPRCVIQVVPEEVTAHPGLAGPFTLLSFDQGEDPKTGKRRPPHDVLYVDGFSRGRTALDAVEVNEGARAYDLLRSYALSPEESADRIGEHLEGLKKQ
ncbi:helix-turn-helix domain-containing protein [Streptomyces demainii]|uniref:Transcriptional regulator with XRE-family HTH domain n=1 Tax=Streptomyces demainii TaxID=588122 RepID=A0ABT9KL68_9ACTN|nr:helix-turn-helix transcriptional regulator [Streptomyces demainii]MDP9609176.1 transcriptional regulator with XRE-family HTH domain [Streptomyces demainii]